MQPKRGQIGLYIAIAIFAFVSFAGIYIYAHETNLVQFGPGETGYSGYLTIEKTAVDNQGKIIDNPPAFPFTITSEGQSDQNVEVTPGTPSTSTLSVDPSGTEYTVTENTPEGWTTSQSTCTQTISPDETKICQFTNTQNAPTITGTCGDGICDTGEDSTTCNADCPSTESTEGTTSGGSSSGGGGGGGGGGSSGGSTTPSTGTTTTTTQSTGTATTTESGAQGPTGTTGTTGLVGIPFIECSKAAPNDPCYVPKGTSGTTKCRSQVGSSNSKLSNEENEACIRLDDTYKKAFAGVQTQAQKTGKTIDKKQFPPNLEAACNNNLNGNCEIIYSYYSGTTRKTVNCCIEE